MNAKPEPENFVLRPITMGDLDAVLSWSQDELFCSANGWELNRTPDETKEWWSRCVSGQAEDFLRMGIQYEGKLIGYADLAFIQGSSAELGVAIGDSSLWGKGLGAMAAQHLMAYASRGLGLTLFLAEAEETNLRSRNMLKRIGFGEVGRLTTLKGSGDEETVMIRYQLSLQGNAYKT
ncbi:hypothetical protein AWM70_09145 [Paenibacillus yonginensis]|uniref:N-acetyltransferase domain-containing protein n=1 Tax=Paenibacillus yonginensis TaxID=1462996 RepID=A0A1B1MZZ6_9BACL|nr:GNAT family N-acetyltransferase [Paenibacillus yonginensis]ANS74738.1 hypothetical protein AWM70_09145 [Paenibacillus yonginensis]